MTLDLHTVAALVDEDRELLVLSGNVTLDESWSPYVQADLVCSLPAALAFLDDLDPTERDVRVAVQLQRDFGATWTNADFTAAFLPNASNGELTAAMSSNASNAEITAMFFHAWNAFGVRDSDIRPLDLVLRGRVVDHVEQTITISLASDEALLQDRGLLATMTYVNDTTSLRALVGYVLQTEIGAQLQPGSFDSTIVLGALEWQPGVDGQEYLQPAIDAAGGRLWCDEQRHWYLTERTTLTPGQLTLATGDAGSVTRASDTVTRDGDWYDAVVAKYTWTDAAGATQIEYDIAGDPATARKVQLVEISATYPGPGYAAALLDRAQGRGRVLDMAAVSDYRGAPGQVFSATLPDTDVQTGVVSALTWRFPDAEMDVRTRGLVDTPPTAWVFDPAGIHWNAIPVGTDWTEDI